MFVNKQGVLSQETLKKRHEIKAAIIANFFAFSLIILGGFIEGL